MHFGGIENRFSNDSVFWIYEPCLDPFVYWHQKYPSLHLFIALASDGSRIVGRLWYAEHSLELSNDTDAQFLNFSYFLFSLNSHLGYRFESDRNIIEQNREKRPVLKSPIPWYDSIINRVGINWPPFLLVISISKWCW